MYRLATKRIAKNEVRNAVSVYGLRLHACIGVENAWLVVKSDTLSMPCRELATMQRASGGLGRWEGLRRRVHVLLSTRKVNKCISW